MHIVDQEVNVIKGYFGEDISTQKFRASSLIKTIYPEFTKYNQSKNILLPKNIKLLKHVYFTFQLSEVGKLPENNINRILDIKSIFNVFNLLNISNGKITIHKIGNYFLANGSMYDFLKTYNITLKTLSIENFIDEVIQSLNAIFSEKYSATGKTWEIKLMDRDLDVDPLVKSNIFGIEKYNLFISTSQEVIQEIFDCGVGYISRNKSSEYIRSGNMVYVFTKNSKCPVVNYIFSSYENMYKAMKEQEHCDGIPGILPSGIMNTAIFTGNFSEIRELSTHLEESDNILSQELSFKLNEILYDYTKKGE